MSADEPVVLVDAENVRRSLWPNLTEEELVERCSAWAAREGVTAVVVFDRGAPAGGGESVRIVEAVAGETADDWIAREAGRLESAGRRFWIVTSDRELRARVGAGAERAIGGGSFARELASRGTPRPSR